MQQRKDSSLHYLGVVCSKQGFQRAMKERRERNELIHDQKLKDKVKQAKERAQRCTISSYSQCLLGQSYALFIPFGTDAEAAAAAAAAGGTVDGWAAQSSDG